MGLLPRAARRFGSQLGGGTGRAPPAGAPRGGGELSFYEPFPGPGPGPGASSRIIALAMDARLRLTIQGAVQGVGFRPFVFRLAEELELAGWVRNGTRGVEIELEGPRARLEAFLARLPEEKPPPALLLEVASEWLPPAGERGFRIEASREGETKSAVMLPDLATCAACRAEIFDPGDRRHGYPFTNCTLCGPRFSILTALPYDRPHTTMRGFVMCPACRSEYGDPRDRRFHAQPNACPDCGPRLALRAPSGEVLARAAAALAGAAAALAAGEIVALKGLGGYQLLCDARDEAAVARLRARKRRPAKPLAVMVRDLESARALAEIGPLEAELLASPQAPIVLLRRREGAALAAGLAPGNPTVGLMLPTTPLHHLLFAALPVPLVATSGNLSDEPIAIDDAEALARLGRIADLFLAHDRPLARHVDDSVCQVVAGAPRLVRRARGYAPLPLLLARPVPTLLATGAHQKVTVALSVGRQVFLSQHIGDLETPEAEGAFARVILDFLRIYEAVPAGIAHDLHPGYTTTRWAELAAAAEGGLLARAGHPPAELPRFGVQHHHAHLAAALAEHGLDGREALGLTWDGTGWGPDGTVWGGEALAGNAAGFTRLARLRPFRLPGSEAAVREPRRVAFALLTDLLGPEAVAASDLPALATFTEAERHLLARLVATGLHAPWTSSLGRLFDAVAALVGLPGRVSFEGEAAIALEQLADPHETGSYPLPLVSAPAPAGLAPGQRSRPELLELDWRPLLAALLADLARGRPGATIAARFHNAMADAALSLARTADLELIVLTGGCFQNRLLTERVAERLRAGGFTPLLHRQVPANDGGLALGQVAVAAARLAAGTTGEPPDVPGSPR